MNKSKIILKTDKPYLAFRFQSANWLTFPVLLNQLEKAGLDQFFHIVFLKNFNRVKQFVRSEVEGVILYSFMSPNLPAVAAELGWIKNNRVKRLKLLAGGPHVCGDPLSGLKAGFDYVFAGPAETGFTDLIRKIMRREIPQTQTVFFSPALKNLDDSMPISGLLQTMPPLEITRGCHWNCRFCQTASQKAIHRSLDSVQKYLREAKVRRLHRRISFICPSAFEYGSTNSNQSNLNAIENLLSIFRSEGTQFLEFGIFPTETRPNSFREEFLELILKYCSNKKITIGAQSGSIRLLKQLRRGHTPEQVEIACEMTFKKKLQPLVDIILGFPGETTNDRRKTLKFMKHLAVSYRARVQVHHFLPLSGTPLWNTIPARLDYRTIDCLKKYQQDGIATNWWEKGKRLAERLVNFRDKLNRTEIEFQKVIF